MTTANQLNGADVLPAMTPAKQPQAKATNIEGANKRPTSKRKSAGRFQTLNAFVDVAMVNLCRGDIVVWLVLYRDTKSGTARTGQTDIARRAGLSVRGVAKAIRRLEKRGLLRTIYRGGLNRGPSRYAVLAAAPSTALTTAEPISSG